MRPHSINQPTKNPTTKLGTITTLSRQRQADFCKVQVTQNYIMKTISNNNNKKETNKATQASSKQAKNISYPPKKIKNSNLCL